MHAVVRPTKTICTMSELNSFGVDVPAETQQREPGSPSLLSPRRKRLCWTAPSPFTPALPPPSPVAIERKDSAATQDPADGCVEQDPAAVVSSSEEEEPHQRGEDELEYAADVLVPTASEEAAAAGLVQVASTRQVRSLVRQCADEMCRLADTQRDLAHHRATDAQYNLRTTRGSVLAVARRALFVTKLAEARAADHQAAVLNYLFESFVFEMEDRKLEQLMGRTVQDLNDSTERLRRLRLQL